MQQLILRDYQAVARDAIIDNKAIALWLDMGLGKTISTLLAIDLLIYGEMDVNKVLIIAPKKVCESVWPDEVEKWEETKHLRVSLILGNERKRLAALREDADIYVINRENTGWLCNQYGGNYLPYDMVVLDESSSFRNHNSQRFKALKRAIANVKRVVELTGTPAPKGYINLWAQMYLLDKGERLGKTITKYRSDYFSTNTYGGFPSYDIIKGGKQKIDDKLKDIVISMKSEDYLKLPECIFNRVNIRLSRTAQEKYDEFEKEQVLSLSDDVEITAFTASALRNKLLQFTSGNVYYDTDKKLYTEVGKEKIDRLKEIIDDNPGKSILVAYIYKHTREMILKELPQTRELKTMQDVKDWNAGKIPILLAHPQSAGHGLNLQYGGNIAVWFSVPTDLEIYQQFNKRLHRSGQTAETVLIHHLIAMGTEDGVVMQALEKKAITQDELIEAMKYKFNKYKKLCKK